MTRSAFSDIGISPLFLANVSGPNSPVTSSSLIANAEAIVLVCTCVRSGYLPSVFKDLSRTFLAL